jgi:DNA-binding transcriptional LysR family regulator
MDRLKPSVLPALAHPPSGEPEFWRGESSLREALALQARVVRALVLREPGSQTRSLLESQLAREGLVPQVAMHAGTREAMREAVAAGLGVGAMFEDEHGHDARLAMVALQGVDARPGVYAVLLKESLGIPSVRAFVDHILSVAAVAPSPRARARR